MCAKTEMKPFNNFQSLEPVIDRKSVLLKDSQNPTKSNLLKISPYQRVNRYGLSEARLALIIDNLHPNHRNSTETKGDAERLNRVLTDLNWQVDIKSNLTKTETEAAFLEFTTRIQEMPTSAVIVFIRSCGEENSVNRDESSFVTKDGEKISLSSVVDRFSAANFPALAGKPKVILTSFCRSERAASEEQRPPRVGNVADMAVVRSTYDGCSPAAADGGCSAFIEALAEVIGRRGRKVHFMNMLTEANFSGSDESVYCNLICGFIKKFYLA